MQPIEKDSTPAKELHFQYPWSDRRRCNEIPEAGWVPVPRLSVSSVGSEAMQPQPVNEQAGWRLNLSVSSVGSEAMQRPRSAGGR